MDWKPTYAPRAYCAILRLAFVLLIVVLGTERTAAQNARDIIDIFVNSAMRLAAQAEWKKLPAGEYACIDQQLLRQQSSIQKQVDAGIPPSDRRLADIRSSCRSVAAPQVAPQATAATSNYSIDKIQLGEQFQTTSADNRDFRCGPSDQFSGYTWCQKKLDMREARGPFVSTWSVLHSPAGIAAYVNRSLDPAFFVPREVDDDISRLTRKHGAAPRIQQMPANTLGMQGTMAIWGDLELAQLDQSNLRELASGRPIRAGFLVDHLGNFQQSVQNGLPVYRVSRGAGYVWVGNWNQAGRGNLRFFAVDTKLLSPQAPSSASTSLDQSIPTAQENIRETLAREEAERQKRALEEAERKRVAEAAAARAATEEAERQKKAAIEAEERRRIEAESARKATLEVERQKAAAEEARLLLERERARHTTILWSIGGIVVMGLTLVAALMIYRSNPRRAQNAEAKAASVGLAALANATERNRDAEVNNNETMLSKGDDPPAKETEPEKATDRVAVEDGALSPLVAMQLQDQASPSSGIKSEELTGQFAELDGMHSEGLLTAEELLEFKYRLSQGLEGVPGKEVKKLNSMSKIWAWLFALYPIWMNLENPLSVPVHWVISSERVSLFIARLILLALYTAVFVLDYRQIPLSFGRWTTTRVVISWLVPPLYFYWRSKLLKAERWFIWIWIASLIFVFGLFFLFSLDG